MAHGPAAETRPDAVGWRLKLDLALFALAFLLWLLVPMAAVIGLPTNRITALTGSAST